MSGKILVISPSHKNAVVYDVDQAGYLAVIATLQEQAQAEPVGSLRMEVKSPLLNIRTGPGVYYPDVGDLHQGDLVTVLEIGGSDCWVRFAEGRWAAYQSGKLKYMTQV